MEGSDIGRVGDKGAADRRELHCLWIRADRDRSGDDVPDSVDPRRSAGTAVDQVEVATVRSERHLDWPLTDWDGSGHGVGGVDHRD